MTIIDVADLPEGVSMELFKSWYELSKENKEITGFWTVAEWAAYEKGREHYEKTIHAWIEKWDGSTNSGLGQLLTKKFKELNDKS